MYLLNTLLDFEWKQVPMEYCRQFYRNKHAVNIVHAYDKDSVLTLSVKKCPHFVQPRNIIWNETPDKEGNFFLAGLDV